MTHYHYDYPRTVYVAYYLVDIPLAVFFDRASADAFALAENEEVQCEVCEIVDYLLVDCFGFPCRPRDSLVLAETYDMG